MGTCYINNEKYDAAKKIFFTVCQTSPTCKTWLGLGIALYNVTLLFINSFHAIKIIAMKNLFSI